MGAPEKTSLETLFVKLALSLKRGAHFCSCTSDKCSRHGGRPSTHRLGTPGGAPSSLGPRLVKMALSLKPGAHSVLPHAELLSRLGAVHKQDPC